MRYRASVSKLVLNPCAKGVLKLMHLAQFSVSERFHSVLRDQSPQLRLGVDLPLRSASLNQLGAGIVVLAKENGSAKALGIKLNPCPVAGLKKGQEPRLVRAELLREIRWAKPTWSHVQIIAGRLECQATLLGFCDQFQGCHSRSTSSLALS